MTDESNPAPKRGHNSSFYNNYRVETAHLNVGASIRSGGKKVFEWKFEMVGQTKPVLIDVHMSETGGHLSFRATSDHLKLGIESSDIEELRRLVEATLIDRISSIANMVWEDWLEVVVKGKNSSFEDSKYSAMGAVLHIQVNRLKRGIHPITGKTITINNNGVAVPFPEPAEYNNDRITLSGLKISDDPTAERSYVPATEANLLALQDILDRTADLRSRIAGVLNQNQIQPQLDNRMADIVTDLPLREADQRLIPTGPKPPGS